jgi:hypothetical protein
MSASDPAGTSALARRSTNVVGVPTAREANAWLEASNSEYPRLPRRIVQCDLSSVSVSSPPGLLTLLHTYDKCIRPHSRVLYIQHTTAEPHLWNSVLNEQSAFALMTDPHDDDKK